MPEKRYFLNLVFARVNLPLPEPLRSEVIEQFNYSDYGKYELYRLRMKGHERSWRELLNPVSDTFELRLDAYDKRRYDELMKLDEKYNGNFHYETEDDGYDDEMIMQCVRYVRDEDAFKLNEKQREIAIELLERELLNLDFYKTWESSTAARILQKIGLPDFKPTLDEYERRIKGRYLWIKYGRRKRLEREKKEREADEERARRGRIAACLGGGFSIDW